MNKYIHIFRQSKVFESDELHVYKKWYGNGEMIQ